jgi:hypothetical protein
VDFSSFGVCALTFPAFVSEPCVGICFSPPFVFFFDDFVPCRGLEVVALYYDVGSVFDPNLIVDVPSPPATVRLTGGRVSPESRINVREEALKTFSFRLKIFFLWIISEIS